MKKTVPKMLAQLGSIYEERGKVYGDNYKQFGVAMMGMFPRGLTLNSVEDFNRFGIFVQMISKMTRYGQAFQKGHADSLDDTAVYSMMLQELDAEMRGENDRVDL